MAYYPAQGEYERRIRGVAVSNSDSGVPSAKSYASASTVDSHTKSLWDSCRSNHKSEGNISNLTPEGSFNNIEAMKKYFSDRNAMQMQQDTLRNVNQNKPKGDNIEEPLQSYTRRQMKDSQNESGDGAGHWPFSFNAKGPRTKREHQNAYRRESDKQIEAKKQIKDKETEKLKKISYEKTPETFLPEQSSNSVKLPWQSDNNEKRSLVDYNTRDLQSETNNVGNFLAPDEKQNSNYIMPPPPGVGSINPNRQHMLLQGPSHGLPPNLLPLGLGMQPNQVPQQYSQPNQPQPFPILKDVNTGIYYQQFTPIANQQQFYYPGSSQQILPMQNVPNENPQARDVFPNNNNAVERNESLQILTKEHFENDKSEIKATSKTDENNMVNKDWHENHDNESIPQETSHSTVQKRGDYRPHVSQGCDQRPGSAVLRADLRLTLDKQMEEKRQLDKQRREKEIEEEKKLQWKIQRDREKAQREIEEENRKRKEKEEAKHLRQKQAFEKEEMLRKETEERKRQEKEQRRKILKEMADEELEYSLQSNEGCDRDNAIEDIHDDFDDRPLPVPATREASTQSAESDRGRDSACKFCSANSRGELSSAVTNYSIPENEESQVATEPLLVEFTSALALEAGRMEKLLHTLSVK